MYTTPTDTGITSGTAGVVFWTVVIFVVVVGGAVVVILLPFTTDILVILTVQG